MAWYDILTGKSQLEEAIKSFKNKGDYAVSDKQVIDTKGEGIENFAELFGVTGVGTHNGFYNSYIDKQFKTERERLYEYRRMATAPEIADVVEDIVNESTLENTDGNIFDFQIINAELSKNKNISDTLVKEFNDLFYDRLDINNKINEYLRGYMIDGKLFYERIIKVGSPKQGIYNIKKLPPESMDYIIDPTTGRIKVYLQYLDIKNIPNIASVEQAKLDNTVIVFEPEQIGNIDYGQYGDSHKSVFGYLEKARVPYNQLKLLETSVIIYRIVRSPERLVFSIDTGNMPKDKAFKFVEKIKQRFNKKQSYDPTTGSLSQEPNVMSILENYYLPQGADGRGSQISSVGGDAKGFTELDDIYYFSRKLYRALKYPMSRVAAMEEKQTADNVFGGGQSGQISRDEMKWAIFLENQQNKLCREFEILFMLHLEFKGIKSQYDLDVSKIRISMSPPSHYKDQMEQGFLEQKFNNYNSLSSDETFSKTFLMKKYLHLTDDDIKENAEGFKKDKEMFPQETPEE